MNTLGASLTAELLPVGDIHNSPITQIKYDKIIHKNHISLSPYEKITAIININERPAKKRPKANLRGKFGSNHPNRRHNQEITGAHITINNGLIDWNHVIGK